MTWGSNASFDKRQCPHCGGEMVDDSDRLGFTHLLVCPCRPLKWWERLTGSRVQIPRRANEREMQLTEALRGLVDLCHEAGFPCQKAEKALRATDKACAVTSHSHRESESHE